MSDEPLGVVFSGYRIINACMLAEWRGCFSTACDRRRPVPPECHTLCSWGLASTEKDTLLLSHQMSLVSMESGAVNLQKLPSTRD